MEDPIPPDPTAFDIAVISAPSSLASVPTSLITASAWTPAAVSTSNTPFGGAPSQVSLTEGVVLQFSTSISTVAYEPGAATSSSLGSFPSEVSSITTTSPPSSPSAAIAGGVVAAIVVVLSISVLTCWLRMHRRNRRSQHERKEKSDIVVETLFDVPPSEVFGDSNATSAGTSEKRKTGSGIFAFINRRQTVSGEANAALASAERQNVISDSAEIDVPFKPMAASVMTKKRQTTSTTSGTTSVTLKNAGRRHTTSNTIEANSAFIHMIAPVVTERQATGGTADMAPNSTNTRHIMSDKAEKGNARSPVAGSEATGERRKADGNPRSPFSINGQRHTVNGISDATIRSNRRVASDVGTTRYTMDGIAEVVPKVNNRRYAAGLKVETKAELNSKRHTISGVAKTASEVTNKRHTAG
ncbi:hypothetical protein MMC26_000265 [Xylographa opegraphella]|nr:hypothetical protein [Xylographa opegraphella]